MKLTKRNIEALAAPKETRIVFDKELPGFGVRMTPAGKKTFVVQYRVGGGRAGRQRRVSVGVFGTISPDDARTAAKKILARAHLGDDFADQRDKTRNSRTVSELIDEWSKGGALISRRTGTRRQQVNINNDIALVNHHLKPLIGSRTLDSLEDVHIHDLRHTFASVGAGGGVGLPLIGGILGHRQASTTQRYAHLADGPLRTAADLIGSELAAALDGASLRSRASPEIVPAST